MYAWNMALLASAFARSHSLIQYWKKKTAYKPFSFGKNQLVCLCLSSVMEILYVVLDKLVPVRIYLRQPIRLIPRKISNPVRLQSEHTRFAKRKNIENSATYILKCLRAYYALHRHNGVRMRARDKWVEELISTKNFRDFFLHWIAAVAISGQSAIYRKYRRCAWKSQS